jgi:hypothetical protein
VFRTANRSLNSLDMHHEALVLIQEGALHLAPLEEPKRILDVGTGTGIWAIGMADKHPKSKVIGFDLRQVNFIHDRQPYQAPHIVADTMGCIDIWPQKANNCDAARFNRTGRLISIKPCMNIR